MLYGALKYNNSCNLGDNIQTLAALQYLPIVDYWIDRDTSTITPSTKERIVVIYNGWFNEYFWNTIPKNVDPIFLSFHLDTNDRTKDKEYQSLQKFRIDRNTKNLERMKAAVGCRDTHTVSYLSSKNINAYFSGCLTLTLNPPKVSKNNSILIVDVDCSIPWIADLPNKIIRTQVTKSHDNDTKLKEAEKMLEEIAASNIVITSRLHTLLPAIAFEVPVIFVPKNKNDIRFGGIIDYVPVCENNVCPVDPKTFTWQDMCKKYNVQVLKNLASSLKSTINSLMRK